MFLFYAKGCQRLIVELNVLQTCLFSPQLLGELLLDRHNFTVMTKYISRAENLKLMMNLLRDNSRNIQFEAFHVFKVGPGNMSILYIHDNMRKYLVLLCQSVKFLQEQPKTGFTMCLFYLFNK